MDRWRASQAPPGRIMHLRLVQKDNWWIDVIWRTGILCGLYMDDMDYIWIYMDVYGLYVDYMDWIIMVLMMGDGL